VDTWAALAAIALAIPFALILPLTLDEFTRDWLSTDRAALASRAVAPLKRSSLREERGI